MTKLTTAARRFVRDEQAATTAEYGIIVVVMAAIALAVLTTFRDSLTSLYGGANTKINQANNF
jgi:Flp pilus assembly pilin Flp